MARFYCDIQGNRGAATRMGTAISGIRAHPRGWGLGIRVDGSTQDGNSDLDQFSAWVSSGSQGYSPDFFLACVAECKNGARRVSVSLGDGGVSVYYVQKDGRRTTREEQEHTPYGTSERRGG